MPDIEELMQEWPSDFEELLNTVGLPSAELDVDLAQYVDLICGR
jgi:intraflagellar transport protein 46